MARADSVKDDAGDRVGSLAPPSDTHTCTCIPCSFPRARTTCGGHTCPCTPAPTPILLLPAHASLSLGTAANCHKSDGDIMKIPGAKDSIDEATFEQILEMDDDEDEREFSKSIVYDFFTQAESTFEKMDSNL